MKTNQKDSAEDAAGEEAAGTEQPTDKAAGQAGKEQAGQEQAGAQADAPKADAAKPDPDKTDAATAKAIEQALADERRKAAKAVDAAVKAALEKQAADLAEQKRREGLAESERLKLELDEHKRKTEAADAEAKRARLELAMHRAMTTDGTQPAGEAAVPLIEAEFLKRAAAGDSPADALAALKKSHGFLFKQPEPAARKTAEQGKADSGAGARIAAPSETPKFTTIKKNASYSEIANAVYQGK